MYEILNSKFYAYYQPVFDGNGKLYDKISLTQSFYLNKNFHFFVKFNKTDSEKEFEIGIKKLF
jgi:predicted porin